jgi:hypothetical protein
MGWSQSIHQRVCERNTLRFLLQAEAGLVQIHSAANDASLDCHQLGGIIVGQGDAHQATARIDILAGLRLPAKTKTKTGHENRHGQHP